MNAGVIAAPLRYQTGPICVETTVAVHVLAHIELLRLSRPALKAATHAHIVNVGSMLTRRIPFFRDHWLAQESYRPRVAYAMTRNAAEIVGFELSRRLKKSHSNRAAIKECVQQDLRDHPGTPPALTR